MEPLRDKGPESHQQRLETRRHTRKLLAEKVKKPQALTIVPEISATDRDFAAAAFGAWQAAVPIDYGVVDPATGEIDVDRCEKLSAQWDARPDKFESKNGFSEEMGSGIERLRELEAMSAEDAAKEEQAFKEFINNTEPVLDACVDVTCPDWPSVTVVAHTVCCCRFNCCERSEPVLTKIEQSPDKSELAHHYDVPVEVYKCTACGDICNDTVVPF